MTPIDNGDGTYTVKLDEPLEDGTKITETFKEPDKEPSSSEIVVTHKPNYSVGNHDNNPSDNNTERVDDDGLTNESNAKPLPNTGVGIDFISFIFSALFIGVISRKKFNKSM